MIASITYAAGHDPIFQWAMMVSAVMAVGGVIVQTTVWLHERPKRNKRKRKE